MEQVPVDSGIIRCICGFDHDDDFTIQCETCNTWQHAICVDIFDESAIPELYLCSKCGDRQTDPVAARERQIIRLEKMSRRGSRDTTGQRGRKRRQRAGDDDKDPSSSSTPSANSLNSSEKENGPIEKPQVYFVPTRKNILTPAATKLWNGLTDGERGVLRRVDSFQDLKPVPFTVHRRIRSSPAARRSQACSAFGLKGLTVVTPQAISRDRFVIEFTGTIGLRSEYISNPVNQWHAIGCPKQGTLFTPYLPLAIDGRSHGSESIFIRRSRQPNIRFELVVDSEGNPHILGYASTAIKAGTELTIPWDWAPGHPIYKLQDEAVSSLAPEEQKLLDKALMLIDEPVAAACVPGTEPEWASQTPATVSRHPTTVVQKRVTAATLLLKQFKKDARRLSREVMDNEPLVAAESNVWQPPALPRPVIDEPVKKKRLSLADYKRKFSS